MLVDDLLPEWILRKNNPLTDTFRVLMFHQVLFLTVSPKSVFGIFSNLLTFKS
jgi:hypothetical protein